MKLEDFHKYVEYDPETGLFRRIATSDGRKSCRVGKITGNKTSNGYLEISVGDLKLSAHKLAWYFHYGYYPEFHLDHINGDKQDNRIINLRESSPLDNMRNRGKNKNNSTGYNGVYKSGKRYRARIKINGKLVNLGTFDTAEEANLAREKANNEYGFNQDHGKRDSW